MKFSLKESPLILMVHQSNLFLFLGITLKQESESNSRITHQQHSLYDFLQNPRKGNKLKVDKESEPIKVNR